MTVDQLNEEFGANLPQLRSFLLRITASVKDMEDLVHDTYVRAADRLDTFRGESSLKTWIFAIASNLAKDNLRAQSRWVESVTDISKEAALSDEAFLRESLFISQTSPLGQFEAKEHIAFCFTCISKSLPLEQQLTIFLKEVYAFKVNEIAIILDCSEAMVKYYLHTARTKMIEIYDGRCALINKNGVCHQCSELTGIYNPRQNAQHELMKLALVQEAGKGDKERLFALRMQILQEVDPFSSPAADLQLHHLEFNRDVMEKYIRNLPS